MNLVQRIYVLLSLFCYVIIQQKSMEHHKEFIGVQKSAAVQLEVHLKTSRGASTVATMSPIEWILVIVIREIWMVQAKRRITSSKIAQ